MQFFERRRNEASPRLAVSNTAIRAKSFKTIKAMGLLEGFKIRLGLLVFSAKIGGAGRNRTADKGSGLLSTASSTPIRVVLPMFCDVRATSGAHHATHLATIFSFNFSLEFLCSPVATWNKRPK